MIIDKAKQDAILTDYLSKNEEMSTKDENLLKRKSI